MNDFTPPAQPTPPLATSPHKPLSYIEFGPTGLDNITIKDENGKVLDLRGVTSIQASLPSCEGVSKATLTLDRVRVVAAAELTADFPRVSLLKSNPQREALRKEMAELLNRHSCENGSNTPDFLLANLLVANLDAFDQAVTERAAWYGRGDAPGQDAQDPALLDGVMQECAKVRLQNGALMQGLSLIATLTPEVVQDTLDVPRMARQIHARLLGKLQGMAALDEPAQIETLRSKIEVLEKEKGLFQCAKDALVDRNHELAELWRSVSDSHHKAQVRIRELEKTVERTDNEVATAKVRIGEMETTVLRAENEVASLKEWNSQLTDQAKECQARERLATQEVAAWEHLRSIVLRATDHKDTGSSKVPS